MNILITGGSGFIGSQIVTDLLKAGHHVTCATRNVAYAQKLFPHAKVISCDFIHDTESSIWEKRLTDIDAVINAVGIFYNPQKKITWATHYNTPKALFDACVNVGIKKIIHISALGVDKYKVPYAESKKAIDDYLMTLPIPSIILRPSLVYGEGSHGGTSLFRGLAGLPGFIPVPGKGQQAFQPIYLPDLSKAIVHLVDTPSTEKFIVNAVSPYKINLTDILKTLRGWLGFSKATVLHVPSLFIRIGSWFGNLIPNSTINTTAYKMLMQNNITSEEETKKFIRLIGFTPRSFSAGVFNQPSTVQDRWHAHLYFIKPLLQYSLAFLWILTAITSAFLYSKTASYGLLTLVGIHFTWQPFFLYSACALNAGLGLALLFNYQVRTVSLLQILLILTYTLIISWKLPYLWLEPFGPISKNIPLLVTIYTLYILESDR